MSVSVNFFRNIPIKRKLILVSLLTSLVTLLLACGSLFVYERIKARDSLIREATTVARGIALNASAPLNFRNEDEAREALSEVLKADPRAVAAAVYRSEDGRLFAHYPAIAPRDQFPIIPGRVGSHFEGGYFIQFTPIQYKNEQVGVLYLKLDFREMSYRLKLYAGISVLVMMASMFVALLLSTALRQIIAAPVVALAETAKIISERKDYSVRARKFSEDELGVLTDAFNQMLAQVQERDRALQQANDELEKRVRERTKDLEQLQRQNALILHSAGEGIYGLDLAGRTTFANPAAAKMTGWNIREMIGQTEHDLLHRPKNAPVALAECRLCNTVHSENVRHASETTFWRKDGTSLPVEYVRTPIIENEELVGTVVVFKDVTDRKQAQANFQKLAAFPRFNPNPVMEFDADGRLTYFNDAALQMAKATGNTDPLQILPSETDNLVKDCLATGKALLRQQTRVDHRTISASFFPIPAINTVHCYATDITERIDLEMQLRHSQKMDAIGQLAAGVAHDFNNILTIIQGHLGLVQDHKLDQNVSDSLHQISVATKRAASLTRQLLMFSRKQVMQIKNLDLNGVINNVGKMLQRLLGEDIALSLNLTVGLPGVMADAGMIEQVILNLAVNARDAMPKGGQLVVGTSAVWIDEQYPRGNPGAPPGQYICLTVQDTGCGMDVATLDRIFEPFFTTKEVGKGTGLGLATAYGIVRQHKGWIEVGSQVGHGTTFRILLPAAARPTEPPSGDTDLMTVEGGDETILLVEDEPALRDMVRIILEQYGYHILQAQSGVEALKVWKEYPREIDLLLTDMKMPEGMNGRELAEKLVEEKPGLKVIYSSGYSRDVAGPDLMLKEGVMFLQKPYHPKTLAKTIRDCLDQKSTPA